MLCPFPSHPCSTKPDNHTLSRRRFRSSKRLNIRLVAATVCAMTVTLISQSLWSAPVGIGAFLTQKEAQYVQLDSSGSLSVPTYGFHTGGNVTPGKFTAATLSYPGASSPVHLAVGNPSLSDAGDDEFTYQSRRFATRAALDADFQFGTYTMQCTNGQTGASEQASVAYSADLYPTSVPLFTSGSWSGMKAIDVAQPFTFAWAPVPAGNGSDRSYVQVFVARQVTPDSVAIIYNSGELPLTATSVTMPAYTLLPDTGYTTTVLVSREFASAIGGEPVTRQLFGFSTVTDFSTPAVPEPTSWSTFALLGVTGYLCRRSRR